MVCLVNSHILHQDTLYNILSDLGLLTSLVLCLDASDPASYPGTGQVWSDVSGQGNHYLFGATSGAEASDPTFVSSGMQSYMSLDGGDYFIPSAAVTFDDDWHKNNGVLTMGWVYQVPNANSGDNLVLFSNTSNAYSSTLPNDGVLFIGNRSTTNTAHFVYDSDNSAGSGGITTQGSNAISYDVPALAIAAFDEAGPATRMKINSNATATAAKTASTNSQSPGAVPTIGASGVLDRNLVGRIFCGFAASAYYTAQNIDDLAAALKVRRFTTIP